MLYDDFGNGFQIFNFRRWICLFSHWGRRYQPIFVEKGKYCTKGARCGKCGTFWREM